MNLPENIYTKNEFLTAFILILGAHFLVLTFSADYYFYIILVLAGIILLFPKIINFLIKSDLFSNILIISLFSAGSLWSIYGLKNSTLLFNNVLTPILLIFSAMLLFFYKHYKDFDFNNYLTPSYTDNFPKITVSKNILLLLLTIIIIFMGVIPRLPYNIYFAIFWLLLIIIASMPFLRSDLKAKTKIFSLNFTLPAVIFICAISMFLSTIDLASWRYAAIGDEYTFYQTTLNLINTGTDNIFYFLGVYGDHPVFVNYLEALFMYVFGFNLWGWHMSYVCFSIIGLTGFFLFINNLVDTKTALISTAITGFSHFYIIFAHLTKDYSIGMCFILLGLGMFFTALKKKSLFLMYFAGVFIGLCFYVHCIARITPILILLGIIFLIPYKKYINYLTPAIFGYLTTLQYQAESNQILTQNAFDRTVFKHYLFYNHLNTNPMIYLQKLFQMIWENITESFKAFIYFPASEHFVNGSLVDIITFTGMILGIIILIYLGFKRNKPAITLSLIIITMFFMTGVFHCYSNPAYTRLYFLIPFCIIPAGIGLNFFITVLFKSTKSQYIAISIFLAIILTVNTYRTEYINKTETSHSLVATCYKAVETFSEYNNFLLLHNQNEIINLDFFTNNLPSYKHIKICDRSNNTPINVKLLPKNTVIIITNPLNIKSLQNFNPQNYYLKIISDSNNMTHNLSVFIPK